MEEKNLLEDARDKAYMLHYICYGSEEYNLCYQEDHSLCSSPKVTHMAVTLKSASKRSANAVAVTHPKNRKRGFSSELERKQKDGLIDPKFPEQSPIDAGLASGISGSTNATPSFPPPATPAAIFAAATHPEKLKKEESKSEQQINQKVDSSVSISKTVLQNYLLLKQNAHGPSVLRVTYCQGLSQKMCVMLKAANWFFITFAKPNGKFINIIWNALIVTQVLAYDFCGKKEMHLPSPSW